MIRKFFQNTVRKYSGFSILFIINGLFVLNLKASNLTNTYEALKNNMHDEALEYANSALLEAKKSNNQSLVWESTLAIASVYSAKGEFNMALEYYFSAVGMTSTKENTNSTADLYNKIGNVYYQLGDYANALNYHLKCLEIYEKLNDREGLSKSYNNLGTVFHKQENYEKALEFYLKSLAIAKKRSNDTSLVSSYINIGAVYLAQQKLSEAFDAYNSGLLISERLKLTASRAILYNNLGIVADMSGDSTLAANYFLKSLEVNVNSNSLYGQAENYIQLGKFYNSFWDYKKALGYLIKAIELAKLTKSLDLLRSSNYAISATYTNLGKYKEALEAFQTYKKAEDMINDNEKIKKFTQLEMQYGFDKKQKEQEFAMLRQRIITAFSIVGMVLMIALAIVVFNSYRRKQRDNMLLEHKNKEIEAQRDEIFQQKKEIMDSIYYARRIQNALLPPEDVRNKLLPEHFVLYLPRDVVSGDFFWVAQKGQKIIITAADCTGHGVPGAFMSMLGIAFLTEIVNKPEAESAAGILNELREYIITYLRQTGKTGESKDGMDMALVVLDLPNNKLEYAGAHNPLYIIRNNELLEYKADRMPIGYYEQTTSFENHTINLEPNDCIYFFSDGFVDQFGGDSGKKYRSRPFKELLVSNHHQSMEEQRKIILDTHVQWKGSEKQIDDILVIGMRV